MRLFLERYWERGNRSSADLASLLSDISTEIWADGSTGDSAQWHDWIAAVHEVTRPA